MIYNYLVVDDGFQPITPNYKQNKYLLSIGTTSERGDNFNGRGYSDRLRYYTLNDAQKTKYDELGLVIKPKKIKTENEKILVWSRRLAKLANIELASAIQIAEEKLDYKADQIAMMQDRDCEQPSPKRGKLINKMERENPLRRIKDTGHAFAIIAASNRHNNTDYEAQLIKAKEGRDLGLIDDAREHARINTQILLKNE